MAKKSFLDEPWFHVVACLISIYFFFSYILLSIQMDQFNMQTIIWFMMALLWMYRTYKLFKVRKK
ncbi:MAG: hypothetical protein U9Q80_02755 [Bacillota bacterium]|nr:hypothetical protein [Bacillota bacterium]